MVYADLAKHVWKNLPEGAHDLEGIRAVKDGKMVSLVIPRYKREFKKARSYRIAVYPHLEDMPAFLEVKKALAGGGPSEDAPGSVGSAVLRIREREFYAEQQLPNSAYVELDLVQAHYKTGNNNPARKPKPLKADENGGFLKRAMASKYEGWRVRALKEAVLVAQRLGTDLLIDKKFSDTARFLRGERPKKFEIDLETALAEAGATKKETDRFLIIKPPKPSPA